MSVTLKQHHCLDMCGVGEEVKGHCLCRAEGLILGQGLVLKLRARPLGTRVGLCVCVGGWKHKQAKASISRAPAICVCGVRVAGKVGTFLTNSRSARIVYGLRDMYGQESKLANNSSWLWRARLPKHTSGP